ncbi:conserved hypothetical protein [Klebsiella quasipneumoniae subsp. similipneumoniae]|nr:conserved hypothetical protein [Klebsiella quasipneumoniae subsp. similipneumoniae]
MVSEAPELFTRRFDEQEKTVAIMERKVFFSGFSFKYFVVSQWACNARHIWIPSIIGTRLGTRYIVVH